MLYNNDTSFDAFDEQFLVTFRLNQSIHLTHFSQCFNFVAPENLKIKIHIGSKWNIGSK